MEEPLYAQCAGQGCWRVTLTGHPARLTALSLSHLVGRGLLNCPRVRVVQDPERDATGALCAPLEHPMLLGLGHGSSSLRVTAGTGTQREDGTAR